MSDKDNFNDFDDFDDFEDIDDEIELEDNNLAADDNFDDLELDHFDNSPTETSENNVDSEEFTGIDAEIDSDLSDFDDDNWDDIDDEQDIESSIEKAKQDPNNKKKSGLLLPAIIGLLLAGGGGFAYFQMNIGNNQMPNQTSQQPTDIAKNNMNESDLPNFDPLTLNDGNNGSQNSNISGTEFPEIIPEDVRPPMPPAISSMESPSNPLDIFENSIDTNPLTPLGNFSDENNLEPLDPLEPMEPLEPLQMPEDIAEINLQEFSEAPENMSPQELLEEPAAVDVTPMLDQPLNQAKNEDKSSDNTELMNAKIAEVEALMEKKIAQLQKKLDEKDALIAKLEKKDAPFIRSTTMAGTKTKNKTPPKTIEKPKIVKSKKVHVKRNYTKSTWVLRTAQPGKAGISKGKNADIVFVEVGDKISGIGTIQSISMENNRWLVKGSRGSVKQ